MKNGFRRAAWLAAFLMLNGMQQAAADIRQDEPAAKQPTEAQIDAGIRAICAKYSPRDQEGCRKREHEAKTAVENFGRMPQAVSDKCTAVKVMDRGYAAVLKCLQDGMAPSDAEAAAALSQFASAGQEQFLGMSIKNNLFGAKIQQDIEFKDLSKYREDANALTDMAREARQEVAALTYPAALSERQRAQFAAVAEAMNAYAEAIVSMDADVAVNSDTGLDIASRLAHDIAASQKAGKKFRTAVMAAYKAFGYEESRINPNTLKLKAQQVAAP